MPVYGIQVRKIDERLRPWNNTYYSNVPDLSTAKAIGEQMGQGEASIHSNIVTIVEAHCWQVGASTPNFGSVSIDLPGALASTNALPPWFTAEVNMSNDGSYPGWHRYRTRVDRNQYEGPAWSDAYILLMETFCEIWDELPYKICTRAGVLFTGMDPNANPHPLQLSKKWYNRTP
jgi:hypothetical protein